MKHLFYIIIILSTPALTNAQVDKATEALKNKQYESAISQYQLVLDQGQTSPEIHYNMGIAYAELDQIGYAIWHFNLAKRAGLVSDDVNHNLRLVKERRKDEIEIIPEFFLIKWWNGWKNLLSSNTWSLLALIVVLSGTYGLYVWRTAEDRQTRKLGFIIGLPLVVLAMLCFITALSKSGDRLDPSQGVLLATNFDLRAAPDYDSAEILTIHQGVDIEVRDQIGEWIKIRLANGQVGWLPMKEVGLF